MTLDEMTSLLDELYEARAAIIKPESNAYKLLTLQIDRLKNKIDKR